MCDRCGANNTHLHADASLLYTDFNDSAGHLQTALSHERYLATCPADLMSPLSQIVGWRIELNLFDDAHDLFLGIVRDIIPSALLDLIFE
eukprot:2215727-Pyramimonas_sp.AAC.1